jgi:hypothetical protein
MKIHLINPSNTELETTVPPGKRPMQYIYDLIGATVLDTVNLRDGRVMIVDDLGHKKNLAVNERATKMYHSVCKPGTTHVIRGPVVIARDADFAS